MEKETQRLQKLAGLLKENSYGQPLVIKLSANSSGGFVEVFEHYYQAGNAEDIALDIATKLLNAAKTDDPDLEGLSNQEIMEEIGLDIVKFRNEEIYDVGVGGEVEWLIIDPNSFSYYQEAIEGLHDREQLKQMYFKLWNLDQDMEKVRQLNKKLTTEPNSKTLGQQALTNFSQNESR